MSASKGFLPTALGCDPAREHIRRAREFTHNLSRDLRCRSRRLSWRYSRSWSSGFVVASALAVALSACATPAQMHSETQLNRVALGCGLALGELIQDEAEKKLLLLVRDNPSPEQRTCVARWARKNGLKTVFVNINFPAS